MSKCLHIITGTLFCKSNTTTANASSVSSASVTATQVCVSLNITGIVVMQCFSSSSLSQVGLCFFQVVVFLLLILIIKRSLLQSACLTVWSRAAAGCLSVNTLFPRSQQTQSGEIITTIGLKNTFSPPPGPRTHADLPSSSTDRRSGEC